jgi:serine/threonine-protein kinase
MLSSDIRSRSSFFTAQLRANRPPSSASLREGRAAVALSSEHAIKVLDVGTLETGEPYMVMEYLAGIDLGQLLHERGALAIQEAVDFVLQASEAVAEAHTRGIVHRDLKPSNLFLCTAMDGRPLIKVLDFGISKSTGAEGSSTLTASGAVMGSPAYMSPEQVRDSKSVDPRSDIWALGVILYELVTGEQPFRRSTLGETFARILSDVPAPLKQLRADVPAQIEEVVSRCVERDLKRRIASVAEFVNLLAPFASPTAVRSVERVLSLTKGQRPIWSAVVSPPTERTLTAAPFGSGEPVETAPSWQRPTSAAHAVAVRSKWWLVASSIGAPILVAGAIVFHHPSANSIKSASATVPVERPRDPVSPSTSVSPSAVFAQIPTTQEFARASASPVAIEDGGAETGPRKRSAVLPKVISHSATTAIPTVSRPISPPAGTSSSERPHYDQF